MTIRATKVLFSSPENFFKALFESERTVVSGDGVLSFHDAALASARIVTYRLFGRLDLNLFEITPHVDIEAPYEFQGDRFEIAYGVEGSFFLHTDGFGECELTANGLFMSPRYSARGKEVYRMGRPFKSVSFNAEGNIIGEVLDRLGCAELWEDALCGRDRGKADQRPIAAAPPDIANSFLQIAGCGYPDRCKRLFFESKFMEIVSKIAANELTRGGPSPGVGEFEASQIKRIPGILMERMDEPPSIPRLARELSLNTATMQRGFKEIFGRSIYAHHRDMCLERAAIMLSDTDKSIFEISADSGYSDCGNFCRAFKKRYGVSPRLYRKN
jgi:AraC-like DNA-binding protein